MRFTTSLGAALALALTTAAGCSSHPGLPTESSSACSDSHYCPAGYTCVGTGCCPLGRPKLCNKTCVPADCACETSSGRCFLPGRTACGPKLECEAGSTCITDGDAHYCVAGSSKYCGFGTICDVDAVCPQTPGGHCCPVGSHHQVDCDFCVRDNDSCCHSSACGTAEFCAPDSSGTCVPAGGEYCGMGQYCPDNAHCTMYTCCPLHASGCGISCCRDDYMCHESGGSAECVPPGKQPCGGTWCDLGEYCAGAPKNLCLPVGADLCPDGHFCDPGLTCAGSSCCDGSGFAQCGSLCCPAGWTCNGNGLSCSPPGATVCDASGRWCNPGWNCSDDGGCLRDGWSPCGTAACVPGQTCVSHSLGARCCPEGTTVVCGTTCCPEGYACSQDSQQGPACVPPNSTICGAGAAQAWCPVGYQCFSKGCAVPGSSQCSGGTFCSPGMTCAAPPCTETSCCPQFSTCAVIGGAERCIPDGAEVCANGATCPAGFFCDTSAQCLPDSVLRECDPEGPDLCGSVCKYLPPIGKEKLWSGQVYDLPYKFLVVYGHGPKDDPATKKMKRPYVGRNLLVLASIRVRDESEGHFNGPLANWWAHVIPQGLDPVTGSSHNLFTAPTGSDSSPDLLSWGEQGWVLEMHVSGPISKNCEYSEYYWCEDVDYLQYVSYVGFVLWDWDWEVGERRADSVHIEIIESDEGFGDDTVGELTIDRYSPELTYYSSGFADYLILNIPQGSPRHKDADLDGLSDNAEIYYALDPNSPSTVDGVSDLQTVLNDATDPDGDGVASVDDNCPVDSNPSQSDVDGDGVGDDCDQS